MDGDHRCRLDQPVAAAGGHGKRHRGFYRRTKWRCKRTNREHRDRRSEIRCHAGRSWGATGSSTTSPSVAHADATGQHRRHRHRRRRPHADATGANADTDATRSDADTDTGSDTDAVRRRHRRHQLRRRPTPPALTCSYSISPNNLKFDAAGGTETINVSTISGCAWTASSGESWITITSGAKGNGTGTVRLTVTRNTDKERHGELTIAGREVNIQQDKDKGKDDEKGKDDDKGKGDDKGKDDDKGKGDDKGK